MEKLIELFDQIRELAGVGSDALKEALSKQGEGGKPPTGEGGPPNQEGGPPRGAGGPPRETGGPPEEEPPEEE